MDEEQGLASPLTGGIRAVRSTVSSSIFGGRQAPVQAQPDPQVTNLLNQNSLALNNVSAQLTNISSQVAGLNGSLAAIKENLSVSDTLERQREAAKRNREAILAEQGLREGKESQIESRIQQALTFPVRRLAQKTQFGLSRLTNFFLILAGGWLTNTVVNMINASADGNTDLFNQLKNTLQKQLLIVGGTMVAVSLGFKAILNGVGALASTALRLGRGGLLQVPFRSITGALAAGTLLYMNSQLIPKGDNEVANALQIGVSTVAQLSLLKFIGNKLFPGIGKKGTSAIVTTTAKKTTETAVKTGAKLGFKGLLKKVAAPFRGKGGFIGSFLIDVLLFGESIDRALAGAAGFLAGVKAGTAAGAAIGALFGGAGAIPGAFIGGLIGGFAGPEIFKGLLDGVKRLFGFKVDKNEESDSGELQELSFEDGSLTTDNDVVVGMRRGGKVRGPSVNRDVVPAMLTPGEFVMTKETTERIGASFFEALNKGGMVDKSITPINKTSLNNVAEKVSSLEEGAPEILSFPIAGGGGGGSDAASDGSGGEATNNVPNIGFNDDNIHTLYAASQYGANA